jgi:hypothetical protein
MCLMAGVRAVVAGGHSPSLINASRTA